uniref:Olfactory receptor 1030-like n=2 Tax=Gouania willdenowi TaxID=441366 RepID=A0A8C5DYK0_GOUWI
MMINGSVFEFQLLGLDDVTKEQRFVLFFLTLLSYVVILFVNLTLIVTIVVEEKLHQPMYIFLCNLCTNSLYGTAAFYPKFLFDFFSKSPTISYSGCLLQAFVIYSYVATDFSVLVLMAYDRYLAICRPLDYHSVMTKKRIAVLVFLSRLVPLFCLSVPLIMTSTLELCDNHIQKLYCENWSVVKLSCSSITNNNIVGFIVIFFYLSHNLFIVCSYVKVIKSALKSKEGRTKFTQTCVPHLLCLLNVTCAMMFDLMYARYGSASGLQSVKNFMAIQFLLVPPILNPIIYGLKLTQVRNSVFRLCRRQKKDLS